MTCSVAIQQAIESRVPSGDPCAYPPDVVSPFRIDNLESIEAPHSNHVGTVQVVLQQFLVSYPDQL